MEFKSAVVINRASRSDRLEAVLARWRQLSNRPPVLGVFRATEGGAAGCLDSHMKVLETAWDAPLLVLEDDAVFAPHFPYVVPPPTDWDVLWLGGQHISRPRPAAIGWVTPVEMLRTHAYVVREPRKLAEAFAATRPRRMDPYLARLDGFRHYVAAPQSVGQAAGPSDTGGEALEQDEFWEVRWPQSLGRYVTTR